MNDWLLLRIRLLPKIVKQSHIIFVRKYDARCKLCILHATPDDTWVDTRAKLAMKRWENCTHSAVAVDNSFCFLSSLFPAVARIVDVTFVLDEFFGRGLLEAAAVPRTRFP